MIYENVGIDDKLIWTLSLRLFFLFLGNELQEILLYIFWDFDDFCAFNHDVCLFDSSAS